MNFLLTDHARLEALLRQISLEWIEATLAHPEQVAIGANGRKVLQSRVVAEGKTYLLRSIVEDLRSPPVVVTVYRTSKIEKYWSNT